jgi:hypothetical protein
MIAQDCVGVSTRRTRRNTTPVDYALLNGGLDELPKRPRRARQDVDFLASTKEAIEATEVLPLPDGHPPHVPGAAEGTPRALLVKQPWAGLLARGEKQWELRSRHTLTRGRVAFVASGTGGFIVGGATLVDCLGPLSRAELAAAGAQHRVPPGSFRYPKCVVVRSYLTLG